MPLNPGDVFAGYAVVRLLGSGGMGEVYLVEHPRLPRQDVLKVLPTSAAGDGDYRRRFLQEADLAAQLWNPHIVRVNDRGEHDGQLWIAMDYIAGSDAGRLLREHYPTGMPAEQVGAIVTPIAQALDYAHQQGVLHRDVKPENILITPASDSAPQRIMLSDFGIARQLGTPTALTATSLTLGTVGYAAPEQLMGEDVDGRADQYALAAAALHLLTGTPPYEDTNPVTVISKHLNADPPRPGERHPELTGLDPVFITALAKDPAARFPTCADFAQALNDAAANVPASAQPTQIAPTPPAESSSPAATSAPGQHSPRRRAWLAGLAAALVVAVVAVLLTVLDRDRSPDETASAPPPFLLNGIYRTTFDPAATTLNGVANPVGPSANDIQWWAFRSACTADGCIATATRLSDHNPQLAYSPPAQRVYRFTEGHWQAAPQPRQDDSPRCLDVDGQVGPGQYTTAVVRSLTPQPDGTLQGAANSTILTGSCGSAGVVYGFQFTAARSADVPAAVSIADPATTAFPPSPTVVPASPASSALDGLYRVDFDNAKATENGIPLHLNGTETEWFAIRSLCSPIRCVATGTQLDDTDHQKPRTPASAIVLEFSEGQWQTLPMNVGIYPCSDGKDDPRTLQWSWIPQADNTLKGMVTTTSLTNDCGTKGDVSETPVLVTRTADAPPQIITADPTLFLQTPAMK